MYLASFDLKMIKGINMEDIDTHMQLYVTNFSNLKIAS
jgi:hypothetical protein